MKKALILLSVLLLFLLPACGQEPPAATEPPEGLDNAWLEELPWEADWVCVLLGDWAAELEPETGKEALRSLLYSYDWILIDPAAQEAEYLPDLGMSVVPKGWETQIYLAPKEEPVRFHLRSDGDLYWNGTLRRPLGENAGAELRERWKSLMELGESAASPPRLTLSCGEKSVPALLHPSYSWSYMTHIGLGTGAESDAASLFYDHDWLGQADAPVLRAEGDVILSFASREPDSMNLTVFTSLGQAPVELRDGRFTPFAGVNTYALSCYWERAEHGGSGGGTYVLLVDGDGPAELPQPEYQVCGSILEADAYGCTFALESGESRDLLILESRSSWSMQGLDAYALFRRTETGGLAWIQPQRFTEISDWICPAGSSIPKGLDWSYSYGTLEPGQYVLLLSCSLLSRNNGRPQADFYLPLPFTLGEDCMPEAPGLNSFCPAPEGVTCTVTQLSPQRWLQTLSQAGEGTVRADRNYSLFRLAENGELVYIPPKYRLPYSLNYPWAVRESESSVAIDLAAYGGLKSGTYVVRRRLYCPTAEEAESLSDFDRSWRTWPEERIRYLDVMIRLSADRSEPDKGVEPMTVSPYAGEETEWPLAASNPYITPESCRFMLENMGDSTVSFNADDARLWFLSASGDWLPLEIRRHKAGGYALVPLAPGEGREYSFSFTSWYAPLAKGTYRLVLPLYAEEVEGAWLAVEFRIRADGTWQFSGMLRPAEITLENYRRDLAERYVWPEDMEVLSVTWNSTGRNWTSDPYAGRWTAERLHGRLRVTVWRDRDVERVKALLGKFGCVDVVRGEDYERKPSGLKEDMMGTLGVLRAEVLEQDDPELYREGTWLLSLEVTEAVQVDWDFVQNVWPEVWDPKEETWYALENQDQFRLAMGYPTVTLQPGLNSLRVVSLGWYKAEFRPGEQYRFVLLADVRTESGERLEYYTCPFTVNENS